MSVDYTIACLHCKEFISLHKWNPDSGTPYEHRDADLYPTQPSYHCIHLDAERVLRQAYLDEVDVCQDQPEHWVRSLLSEVRDFLKRHTTHILFRTTDFGDEPWCFGEPEFAQWKEVAGTMSSERWFLPRNLIEDRGIHDVDRAIEAIHEHDYDFMLMTNEDKEQYRLAFEEALQRACEPG